MIIAESFSGYSFPNTFGGADVFGFVQTISYLILSRTLEIEGIVTQWRVLWIFT
jgi:hypothetical protein